VAKRSRSAASRRLEKPLMVEKPLLVPKRFVGLATNGGRNYYWNCNCISPIWMRFYPARNRLQPFPAPKQLQPLPARHRLQPFQLRHRLQPFPARHRFLPLQSFPRSVHYWKRKLLKTWPRSLRLRNQLQTFDAQFHARPIWNRDSAVRAHLVRLRPTPLRIRLE